MKEDKKIHTNGEEKKSAVDNISSIDNPKKNNPYKTLIIILIISVAVMIIAFGLVFYFIFKNNSKDNTVSPSASASSSQTDTPTASPKKRVGWQIYTNSRFNYSMEVPPNLEKTESINGDGASFTNWDPPMTIRVWATNNSLGLTAQQAIDSDKQSLLKDGMENFRVIVEGPIEMGGEPAIESVWQYIAPPMGDAATSARAYVVKNNIIYSIEFLIDTSQWNSYSTMFDDVFESFKFL